MMNDKKILLVGVLLISILSTFQFVSAEEYEQVAEEQERYIRKSYLIEYAKCRGKYDCIFKTCKRVCRYCTCAAKVAEYLLRHHDKARKAKYSKCKADYDCILKVCKRVCPKGLYCQRSCAREAENAYIIAEEAIRKVEFARCGRSAKCINKSCYKRCKDELECYECSKAGAKYLLAKWGKGRKSEYKKCKGVRKCVFKICRKFCPSGIGCRSSCGHEAYKVKIKFRRASRKAAYKRCNYKYKCLFKACKKHCSGWTCEKDRLCRSQMFSYIARNAPSKVNKKELAKVCKLNGACLREVCTLNCKRGDSSCSYYGCRIFVARFLLKVDLKKKYGGCAKSNYKFSCLKKKCEKKCRKGSCKWTCHGEAVKYYLLVHPGKLNKDKEYKKCNFHSECLVNTCKGFCNVGSSCRCGSRIQNYLFKHGKIDKEAKMEKCNGDFNCIVGVCMIGCHGRGCYRGCRYTARNYIRDYYHDENDYYYG